jgi:uncharacterized protein YjbI with pentapeptide repeats
MTETNHVSLLRQGKAAWSAWREANPSAQQDFREANLTGANLAGALLRGVDLGKANLSRANLTDAILGSCDFSGAIYRIFHISSITKTAPILGFARGRKGADRASCSRE